MTSYSPLPGYLDWLKASPGPACTPEEGLPQGCDPQQVEVIGQHLKSLPPTLTQRHVFGSRVRIIIITQIITLSSYVTLLPLIQSVNFQEEFNGYLLDTRHCPMYIRPAIVNMMWKQGGYRRYLNNYSTMIRILKKRGKLGCDWYVGRQGLEK